MDKVILFLVLLAGVAASQVTKQSEPQSAEPPSAFSKFKSQYFEAGDPRLCMEVDRNTKFDVQRFEVLPGTGWDNLQNIPKGQVIDYNYSRCLSTDDGRYLLPDQVFAIPLKASYVDTFAEIFDTWHNTSDSTSTSVNVNAGATWATGSISGSYSHEHTQIKKKQMEDKAITVRVQLRYHRYKSQLQPDSTLHRTFKRRLLNIAGLLQLNQTQLANYEAQLIVRDFGTHVLTSVTAGAGLLKTDFLKRDYVASQFSDKTKVTASASASFGSFFSMGGNFEHSTDTEDYKSYLKAVTHSYVTSHGGPIMKAFNMSANIWTAGVDLDLVAMDRTGDPLSFLVTAQTLPELPVMLVHQVEKVVRTAIVQYYEMNTIHGCTKMGSPNFSFSANFDDGSCEVEANNMTFGGVYQTCSVQGQYINNNPCSGMSQVNPKTRALSCPSPYTAVKLVTGRKVGKPEYKRECHSCGLFGLFSCCDTHEHVSTGVYTAYWCAALSSVPEDSGYLFGGVYSQTKENPITGNKGCPPSFYPRIFLDLKVCISDDFEVGLPYSVPFGGFMSCSMGNPLSTPGVHPVGGGLRAPAPDSLQSFMLQNNDPSSWPKHCPKGYSQHLVSIDNGCEVRYCLMSGSLSGPNLPTIKLPPYHDKPNMIGPKKAQVMFNLRTQEWLKNEPAYAERFSASTTSWSSLWSEATPVHPSEDADDHSGMAPGTAAAIGVVVTLCCGILALLAYVAVQRRRHSPIGGTRRLAEDTQSLTASGETTGADEGSSSNVGAVSYGSLNNQDGDTCSVTLPSES